MLTRHLKRGAYKEEIIWLFRVDMIDGRGRCIKRSVQTARKSVKFLLSPVGTVQFTAKSATQSEKITAVKTGVNWRKK